jgi:UDP-glucuronate 4-epimerase
MKDVVLVTGAAGFIGSHLVERLLCLGHRVVGLDNFDDCYPATIKLDNISALRTSEEFRLVRGDIRDAALLERLFEESNITVVAHLAARAGVRPSIEQPLLYQDVNIRGTINLLEASRAGGVKQLILTSSSSVYGLSGQAPFSEETAINFPVSPYAASKAAAELFGRAYSYLYCLPVVVLRPFTVYGPRQRPEMAISRFVGMIDGGEEITLFGDGTSHRDYTYIDDVIDGFERALAYRGEVFQIFNLGAGRMVELGYLVELIEKALGKKARVKYVTAPPGEVPITHADISKAQAVLGYQPKTPVEEGIPRFVEWYLRKRRCA